MISIQHCNYKDLDYKIFNEKLSNSNIVSTKHLAITNLEDYVDEYNGTIREILDELCPIKSRLVKLDKSNKWYNNNLREMKRMKRRLERKFIKSPTPYNKTKFKQIKYDYNKLTKQTRIDFYAEKLDKFKHDPKNLNKTLAELTGNKQTRVYPTHAPDQTIAEEFASFYVEKIQKIRNNNISESTENNHFADTFLNLSRSDAPSLSSFEEINLATLITLMKGLKKKFCALDPCPTTVLSETFEPLYPVMLNLVNGCISSGEFPENLKKTIIQPVLKDFNLDQECYNHFRPLNSLPFSSKIVEKVIHLQLNYYIETNKLYPQYQSAYREHHSCETALLKMTDEIQLAISNKQSTCLLMLDSSAAFDTVDQSILLNKLERNFNIRGGALKLIKSYFTKRTFCVKINDAMSTPKDLANGVPQGSLLGPVFYVLYTKDIEQIVKYHGLKLQCYADDVQVYISFREDKTNEAENKLVDCLKDIKNWMSANFLKLNTDKTQIKIFQHKTSIPPMLDQLGECCSKSVKLLGVNFDQSLKFNDFITTKIRKCNFQLRNLYNIRNSLNTSTRIMLVTTLILSTIDYCNILLLGATNKELRPLQLIINKSLRFIYDVKRRHHITPFYKKSHILPIKYRIKFKACLTAFNIFNNLAPNYLTDDFEKFSPTSNMLLREGTGRDCFMFEIASNEIRSKRLSTLIKKEWNSIPLDLRKCETKVSFKTKLKTYFFVQSQNV